MKKANKRLLRIVLGLLLLFFTGVLAAYVLIAYNKVALKEMAETMISKEVKGEVTIGDLRPVFWQTFPNISVRLTDVIIRDSLWHQHQHDLLNVKHLSFSLSFMSLLKAKPQVSTFIIEDGIIHLYTDACGYKNLNRVQNHSPKKENPVLPDIVLKDVRLMVENDSLNSLHDLTAKNLRCRPSRPDSFYTLNITMQTLVHGIGFNLEKGSYLKEKTVDGRFKVQFQAGHKLWFENTKLTIDRHPLVFDGAFNFETPIPFYTLHIETNKIPYAKAKSLLTESLQGKLAPFVIQQTVNTEATISGRMAPRVQPTIDVLFSVEEVDMETPAGPMTACSYSGHFTNHIDTTCLPGDPNSTFVFHDVKATYSNIPFTSNQIEISNLIDPFLSLDLQSDFDLTSVNALAESSTIRFIKGNGKLDVVYSGSLIGSDQHLGSLDGELSFADTEVNYLPRNLVLSQCSGKLEFREDHLVIPEIKFTSGTSHLTMKGSIENLISSLNNHPEKLTIIWSIATPALNMGDFITYVGQQVKVDKKIPARQNKIFKTVDNLDRMLSDGTAKITLSADKLIYKKFTANRVSALMWLLPNQLLLKEVDLYHAGGQLTLNGSVTNARNGNLVKLDSKIIHADIPGLFYAFDNFGQDAITHQNLHGKLSAIVTMSGTLTDKAEVVENSMKGTVGFKIKEGALNKFEPVEKVGAAAFKNRNFSYIQFGELINRLDINGTAITVHKMEIRSSVIDLFAEGIYDTKRGTDMSIQVPLSNLSNADDKSLVNKGRVGANIRLRAKTAEDGKLKVSWDPFNKASKERMKELKPDS